MKKIVPKVLVLSGDGINCEKETAFAFKKASFNVDVVNLNDLIIEIFPIEKLIFEYKVLALPGGFSFGDDLGSGRVLALKIQHGLRWNLDKFVEAGGMVLGICNGFQALIRLGVFGNRVSITTNMDGKFIDKWVRVFTKGTNSPWLSGIGSLELPIRHAEGRIVFEVSHRQEVVQHFDRFGMSCLFYDNNPNGSESSLAGLCDSTGRILGLMPHPEAFTRWSQYPDWLLSGQAMAPGQGLRIFENAYREVIKE